MNYRINLTPEAQAAIDRDIAYVRARALPEVAERWYQSLMEAIESLSSMPTRCAVIPEQWLFDVEHRHLLYGRRHHERRIIFFVDEDTVHIVHYRHGNLPPLSGQQELEQGLLPE